MKRYLIILIIVTIIGFSFPIIIIYNAVPHKPKPEIFYLNTAMMKEAGTIDSFNGPALDTIFPCDRINNANDSIPWANLYVCHSYNKTDSLIILLDTHTSRNIDNIKDPSSYWTGLKPSKKFNKCKVLIPVDEANILRRYHYKYGSVIIITDD